MLTTKVISPKQGRSYYAQDNSYSTAQSVANSQWLGKGAAELGLTGQVKSADFENLLCGKLPDGTNFRQRRNERKGYKERAGLDCTFSAPKSVSILALVAGKKEIEKAHTESVAETLKIIEEEYASTRVTQNGKVVHSINTGNLVVAQFHHDTSRELDPHLHTHCVILNLSEYNNKWYSFRNDDIFANRKLLGNIYRNQLALKVKELGYDIETKKDGLFEVQGFSQQHLRQVSKRRQQIVLQKKEHTTWSQEEKIWDKTRSTKTKAIPRKELQRIWRTELQEVNYPSPSRDPKSKREEIQNVNQAIDDAIATVGDRSVSFKPQVIQKFILSEVGTYDYQDISKAIASNNELVYSDKQITTQTSLLRQLTTIKLIEKEQNKLSPIASKEVVERFTLGLNPRQTNAVTLAATKRDRFMAWQGKPRVSTTYALNHFKELAKATGYTVKGFAPTEEAAQVLSQEMEIETNTVDHKLVTTNTNKIRQAIDKPQIWIVKEAQLLGVKTAQKLLQAAEIEDARVLLVGDTKREFVAGGNPFQSLQQAGMATAHLDRFPQPKTANFKQAVDLIAKGEANLGIEILEQQQHLVELRDLNIRTSRIARDYLSLDLEKRQKTLVIASTNQERQLITDYIRQGLKQEGSLRKEVKATKLKSQNLTSIQKQYAHHYQPGNVVIPFANYKRLGLKKNQQYRVSAVDKYAVELTNQNGYARKVNPKWFKHKDVYRVEPIPIAVGDKLRWSKHDRHQGRVNEAEFVVSDYDGTTATIKTAQGRAEKIDLENAQHLDHALVNTLNSKSLDRVTADRVLLSLGSDLTTNAECLYAAVSLNLSNIKLYVEDRGRLLELGDSSPSQANSSNELIFSHSSTQIFNYERNHPKPDPSRNSFYCSQSDRATSRKPRIRPERIAELAQHISRFVDEQETESLEGSFRRLKQHLDNRIRATGRTAKLRDSIKQLDRTLTEYTSRSLERVANLDLITNSVEESILSKDRELTASLSRLTQTFRNHPLKLNNLKQLQATVARFQKLQQQSKITNSVEESILSNDRELAASLSRLNRAFGNCPLKFNNLKQLQATVARFQKLQQQSKLNNLVLAISDISDQQQLKVLTPSFERLNTQLQNLNLVNQQSSINIKELQHSIERELRLPVTKLKTVVISPLSSLNTVKKLKQQYAEVRLKLGLDSSSDSSLEESKEEPSKSPLPQLSPLQMESRQHYLDAKDEVLKSTSNAQLNYFAFDVEVAKSLKSKSWSSSEIAATLTQSDYAHDLFRHNKHDHYRHRIAKYIYSVGTTAGLTFENEPGRETSIKHSQLPYKSRKSEPELEL